MRSKLLNFFVILLAVFVGAAVTFVVIKKPFSKEEESGILGCQYTSCTNKVVIERNGINESVKKIYDAVVVVENFYNKQLRGTGSGFVYKKDNKYGYIMTNQHVVQGSNSLKVLLSDGKEIKGELLGGDAYLDIAIVRIPVKNVKQVAEIGSTKDLKIGDFVFAVGTPIDTEYFNSITSGVISGIDREVTVTVKTSNDWVMKVLQIDAPINPGNSGGPLVNSNGEVIGVNSLKLIHDQIEGMGFSIKIEDAMSHIKELEAGKKIDRPLLGISLESVENAMNLYRYGIELDDDITYGVVVIESSAGAKSAGLEKGDVIIKIEGEKVKNAAFLKYVLYKYNIGDEIKVTFIRDGKEKTVKVKLQKNTD